MTKRQEKLSKTRKKINEIYESIELANLETNKNRARSFTVGTAFGGVVEVGMRGDFHSLWCLLQPVEAVEFIEQLAAAAGLQVAVRPKQDFSTWRSWNFDTDSRYWVGAAPWQLPDHAENKQLNGSEENVNSLPQSEEGNVEYKEENKEIEETVEE